VMNGGALLWSIGSMGGLGGSANPPGVAGATGASGSGGGLFNLGTAALHQVNVASNRTTEFAAGGAITNAGTLALDRTTVARNWSGGDGGGLSNTGTATIVGSTFAGNTVAFGRGGGLITSGTLTMTDSTVSSNVMSSLLGLWGVGAGVVVTGGSTTLRFVTITANQGQPGSDASGLLVLGGSANVGASIVAAQLLGADCAGAIVDAGSNVESATSCGFTGPGDLQNTDPALGGIDDNGGPTMTHLPGAVSPAVNAIPAGTLGCGTTVTTDQRGLVRPSGGACDIGAVER